MLVAPVGFKGPKLNDRQLVLCKFFLRLLILPVQRVRLVVADGGINGGVREFFSEKIVEFFHDVRILFVA
jgi:hypothetical protein